MTGGAAEGIRIDRGIIAQKLNVHKTGTVTERIRADTGHTRGDNYLLQLRAAVKCRLIECNGGAASKVYGFKGSTACKGGISNSSQIFVKAQRG